MADLDKRQVILHFNSIANKVIQYGGGKIPPSARVFIIAQLINESNWGRSQNTIENHNYGNLTTTTPNGEDNRQSDDVDLWWATYKDDDDYARSMAQDFLVKYNWSSFDNTADSFINIMADGGYIGHPGDRENYMASFGSLIDDVISVVPDAGADINYQMPFSMRADTSGWGSAEDFEQVPVDLSTSGDEDSFFEKTYDTFRNAYYKSGIVEMAREGYLEATSDLSQPFNKNDPTVQTMLAEAFPNDKRTQNYILCTARSPEHFKRLLEQRKADKELEYRTERRTFGMHSVVGGLGSMILDPVNIATMGVTGFAGGIASRLGIEVFSKLGLSTAERVAMGAMGQGLLNVADEALATKYGLREENPYVAFAYGAGTYMGMELLRGLGGALSRKTQQKITSQLHASREKAVKIAGNLEDLPDGVRITEPELLSSDMTYPQILREAVTNPEGKVSKLLEKDFKRAKGEHLTNTQYAEWLENANNVIGYELVSTKTGKSIDVPKEFVKEFNELKKLQQGKVLKSSKVGKKVETLKDEITKIVSEKKATITKLKGEMDYIKSLKGDAFKVLYEKRLSTIMGSKEAHGKTLEWGRKEAEKWTLAELKRIKEDNPRIIKKIQKRLDKRIAPLKKQIQELSELPKETEVNKRIDELVKKFNKYSSSDDFVERAVDEKGDTLEYLSAHIVPITADSRGVKSLKGFKMKSYIDDNRELYIPDRVLQEAGITPQEFKADPMGILSDRENAISKYIEKQTQKQIERQGLQEAYKGDYFIDNFTVDGEKLHNIEPVYKEVGKLNREVIPVTPDPDVKIMADPMASEYVKNGLYWDILRKATKFFETNTFTGTKYGLFRNSESKTLRSAGAFFFSDPLQRNENLQRTALEDTIQALNQQPEKILHKFSQSYKDFCFEQHLNPFRRETKRKFNRLAVETFEKTISDEPSEAIRKAVQVIEEFRKHNKERAYNGGIIDILDFGDSEKELYRVVDPLKLRNFILQFDSEAEASEALVEWAMSAIKRGELEKGADVAKLAREWVDHVLSISNPITSVNMDKSLKHWKKRIPMDLSMTYTTKKGVKINFNDDLRDFDMFRIMENVNYRTNAELAFKFHGVTDSGQYSIDMYNKIVDELNWAVKKGKISQNQANKELKNFRSAYTALTRTSLTADDLLDGKGTLDYLIDIIRTVSYAQNGQNMWLLQYLEGMGSIGTVGGSEMLANIPGFGKFVEGLRKPREHTPEQLDMMKDVIFGMDLLQDEIFNPKIDVQELLNRQGSKTLKALGKVQDATKVASAITSQVNQLSRLTNHQVQNIKLSYFCNLMNWAKGRYSSTFAKTAFERKNFEIAGITDLEGFRQTLQKRLCNLGNEKDAIIKAMRKWEKEDLLGATKFYAFLNVNSRRGILQPTIGSSNLHISDPTKLLPILHQFKEFSRMALHSHVLRALNDPRTADLHALNVGAVNGALAVALRTYIYANFKFDDPRERQQYLEKNMTPDRLFRASLAQNAFLAGTSYLNDVYEMFSDSATVRTTAGRENPQPVNSFGDFIGNVADQTPAIGAVSDLMLMPRGIADYLNHSKMTGREERAIRNLFPISKNLAWQTGVGIINGLEGEN